MLAHNAANAGTAAAYHRIVHAACDRTPVPACDAANVIRACDGGIREGHSLHMTVWVDFAKQAHVICSFVMNVQTLDRFAAAVEAALVEVVHVADGCPGTVLQIDIRRHPGVEGGIAAVDLGRKPEELAGIVDFVNAVSILLRDLVFAAASPDAVGTVIGVHIGIEIERSADLASALGAAGAVAAAIAPSVSASGMSTPKAISATSTRIVAKNACASVITTIFGPSALMWPSLNSMPIAMAIKPSATSEMIEKLSTCSPLTMPKMLGPIIRPAIKKPVTLGKLKTFIAFVASKPAIKAIAIQSIVFIIQISPTVF